MKKACTKCLVEKELDNFYKNGKESRCKTCSNIQKRLYLYPNQHLPRGQKSSEQRKQTQARYREKNREKIREKQRLYVVKNKHKVLARTRQYQCAKKNATPNWLTDEHRAQIQAIYFRAASLSKEHGKNYEVDHVVPISGKNVKGLHVPWNLQIIERSVNRAKHNKY